ncbi:hypothetical protein GE118_00125 [Mycoplasma sp. NEAQ87857]|uniref:MYPU_1760 family metalloprotease n=1 Tax=Mycoplasma sp. NEAQ87857 TaxID=2683967 RepID=UPI001316B271|nr:hypothetical protein [Mycoplasma sp. NEAQ87857]QGZ97209.1 hypothetical protein GE118_00125 [Mycoplasma sp. NEAQ87857]
MKKYWFKKIIIGLSVCSTILATSCAQTIKEINIANDNNQTYTPLNNYLSPEVAKLSNDSLKNSELYLQQPEYKTIKKDNGVVQIPDLKDFDINIPYNSNKIRKIYNNEYLSVYQPDSLKDKELNHRINKFDNNFIHTANTITYIDPYLKLKFVEFKLKNQPYILGEQGLRLLAQEFKRKVPFGPEVFDLDSISINDNSLLKTTSEGIYYPDSKKISISMQGQSYETVDGLNLFNKVISILPVVFHEYIHHWANSYTFYEQTNLLFKPNQLNNQLSLKALDKYDVYNAKDYYKQDYYYEAWNYNFATNFKQLLNYDVDQYSYINQFLAKRILFLNPKTKYLYRNFTLATLYKLANEKYNLGYIDPSNKYAYTPLEAFNLDLKNILYYYSLSELVAREYTKFAFEPYYNINSPKIIFPESEFASLGASYFGNGIFSDYGDRLTNDKYAIFKPSSYSDDWSRVYLNNENGFYRQGNYIPQSIQFPNSVFDISSYKYINKATNKILSLDPNKTKNRSIEFYQLFLATMGYGKSISNIYTKNNKLKISGYLKTNKYKGIVYMQNNKIYETVKLDYLPSFHFFGHHQFDQGANLYNNQNDQSLMRLYQLGNRLYPKEKYYSYITDKFIKVKDNTNVYFWEDKNNDNIVQNDEIDYQFNNTIPSYRIIARKMNNQTAVATLNTGDSNTLKIYIK